MPEWQKMRFGGAALIVIGIGTCLFGGTVETGSYIEILGLRFGQGECEPMGRAASWFWGLAMIVGGAVLIHYSFVQSS